MTLTFHSSIYCLHLPTFRLLIGPVVSEKSKFLSFVKASFVPESFHTKFGYKWPSSFQEKQVLIFICKCPGAKVKKMTIDLPYLDLLNNLSASDNFQGTGFNSFWKNPLFSFFSYRKAQVTKFYLAINLGQGPTQGSSFEQTMMGWESSMLHTKFRGNQSTGSGE